MKLQMSLPERPGMLHALPLLDLIALVLIFPLLGPSFVPLAGVEVKLPENDFRMQRFLNPIVVTVTAGQEPQIWVGKTKVRRDMLLDYVAKEAESWKSGGAPVVHMKVDRAVPDSFGEDLSYELLRAGYRCWWVAKMRGGD
ncbi:hypothetical protein SAMN02745181_3569 [Rubritalea squalenifaciens DSM 18772]|uniref:Biopolymer transport protein ExbD n=2 Tax=Rubritalea TaxID=361050 RepID=A0A1M6R7S6_9BACT|nr:hypothetical protein [Rubritalea squalenifaciens]SHK28525.1 hypothetical protein SAMN02745181_3569 [Rubritalea squalenifaciens DSM 18772]